MRLGRLSLSSGWPWRYLWRVEDDGYRLCVFGVLAEWSR